MTIEDVYDRLLTIKDKVKDMNEEDFDKTKAFRFVYHSVLDIIDDLSYIEDSNGLFEDEESQYEIENETWIDTTDDLIGDDEDDDD